ncbi:MAG: hypothetical protein AAGI07_09385 [Bacteroidota bacterium]
MKKEDFYKHTMTAKISKETDELFIKFGITSRKSLSPLKQDATSYYELGKQLYYQEEDDALCSKFCEVFHHINKAQLYHFPENIFWDMDFIFFSTFSEMKNSTNDNVSFLDDLQRIMIKLLGVFGKYSCIKFRYIHDFNYGFDWAKWVKKDEKNRKTIAPFSIDFLKRMYKRGEELLALIQQDDKKYNKLGEKENYRNPFLFIREPDEEIRLLSYLARNEYVPVACWNRDTIPNWKESFEARRAQASTLLGIVK